MFKNRIEAGKLLAKKLVAYKDKEGVILAVPRGGVPLAAEVARELHLPLDIILVKKIGHPFNKEYAIGAAGMNDSFVIPHENVSDTYVNEEIQRIRIRLKEMQHQFLGEREPINLQNKTIIVIDDGIATGNTLLATIKILKKSMPSKIIIATPVVSRSAAQKLEVEVDELVSLMIPEYFNSVGGFYDDFRQVEDQEVIDCLAALKNDEMVKAGDDHQ